MRQLLFLVFPDRRRALAARDALRDRSADRPHAVRLHDGELDLMLGVDLSGTRSQNAHEIGIAWRFGLAFAVCAGLGLVLDTTVLQSGTGLVATMALGSVGVALGTLFVLLSATRPLEDALTEAAAAMRQGAVVLTVPLDVVAREAADLAARSHGGRRLFEA